MDRYPGYESMLARVEHMTMQVKAQLPTEYSQTVDNLVAFVLDQVNQCCNVATVDVATDTAQDYPLSGGPVARADDTRIDVNEHVNPASPQVDHHIEDLGSISSGQSVTPPSPQSVTHSTIPANIEVKVEDESNGQSVQLCEWIKKEEDEDDYEEQLFHCCDCGGEGCEECKVKREIKEEFDESGCETELGGSVSQVVQGCTRVKKEEEDDEVEGERPKKMRRSSSSSAQHVNEPLRDELLSAEPRMDNVALVVDVGGEEFDREQIDEDNSTLNPVHTDQDGEEDDETTEQREDTSVGDELQVQVSAQSFVKRIEPADELGNRFECDYRGCGRRMKDRSNLIRHIRTHTGEKRFKCSVAGCDRAFATKDQLKVHLNTHSGTRSFVCTWPGCEAQFAQKIHFTVHTRTHTGERRFKCDQCSAAFSHQSSLVIHLRTHTGVRPFVCTWPDCGQAFITSSHLKIHSIVHSNERQFECDVTGCTKVYKHKDALRRHQKDKHN